MPTIVEKDYAEGIAQFFADRLELVRPERSKRTVSEVAEALRVIPRGLSSVPGPFKWATTPYFKEPADCFSDSSPVQRVAIMKASRLGASVAILENILLYSIAESPAPVLYISGDRESAEQTVELRIDRMIESAGLQDRIHSQLEKKTTRKSGDTKALKSWSGGYLVTAGPNTAAKLRNFGVKIILFDEVDAYPASTEDEGDAITLATRRSDEYEQTRKILYLSTPLNAETSRIVELFRAGDRRYFEIPCPHCGFYQTLKWRDETTKEYRLIYEVDSKGHLIEESVRYLCENPACGKSFRNSDKAVFLQLGRWTATAIPEEPNFRSYHLSALYSPWRSWASICREWLKAKDDTQRLKPFLNTVLGEPWEEKGETIAPEKIMARRGGYLAGTLPSGHHALFNTIAVDVQTDRLEAEIRAWGRGKQSWSVEYLVIPGDTLDPDSSAWKQFETVMRTPHAELPTLAVLIDCGFRTPTVMEWTSRWGKSVLPCHGDPNASRTEARYIYRLSTVNGVSKKRVDINTLAMKNEAASLLQISTPNGLPPTEPLPGHVSFPDNYDASYFRELTAEERRVKNGHVYWYIPHGKRNEAWDCFCMNLCSLYVLYGFFLEAAREEEREHFDWNSFWDQCERELKGGDRRDRQV